MGTNQSDVGSFDASAFLAQVSGRPGVYIYRDADDKVLYVGKAKNLKKRVSSYFRKTALPTRTMLMVSKIASAETHQTHTEAEALLLENNLIKQYRPHYNVLLKDDKSYPYIRLLTQTRSPWLTRYRGSRSRPGRYFGPFPSSSAVTETLNTLERIFKLRQCTETVFKHRSRPCLQYQIKRCSAPCVGRISDDDYAEDVRQAVAFLEGRDHHLTRDLGEKMETASERLDFEAAAIYRDRIAALQRIQATQYVTGQQGNADVIAVAAEGGMACFYVSNIRHGRLLGGRYHIERNQLQWNESDLLRAFVPQHYIGQTLPDEILLSAPLPEAGLITEALYLEKQSSRNAEKKPRRVEIKHQCRGHRLRWIKSAKINADDYLRQTLASHSTLASQYQALADALNFDQPPQRMECFDISHTGGEKTVASCVVFDSNGALKSDYRRFNINDIEPGDDYAAMKQVLTRRYKRLIEEEAPLPDLIIVDGGKGQLRQATEVLGELQRSDIPLLGVSKGPERKAGEEQLHLAGDPRPILLGSHAPALHLIQQIRDEAHRFAITGHRQRRAKKITTSPLEQISGIGEKRRQKLLKHFGGLQEVKNAGIEDLAKVSGLNNQLAQKIYDAFH